MNNAALDLCAQISRSDGVRVTAKTINKCNQDFFQPSILQLIHHRKPKIAALAFTDPKPKDILLSCQIEDKEF